MLQFTLKVWVELPQNKLSRFVSRFKIRYPFMYTFDKLYFCHCFQNENEIISYLKKFKNYNLEYEIIKH